METGLQTSGQTPIFPQDRIELENDLADQQQHILHSAGGGGVWAAQLSGAQEFGLQTLGCR